MCDVFGGDPFPFGIEENRPTIEQLLLYTWQQGIAHRHAHFRRLQLDFFDRCCVLSRQEMRHQR